MYTDLYSKMDNAHWTMAQMANEHWPFCCINRYTSDTHGVKAFQSVYSAIQYTAIQLYIAIHYTTCTPSAGAAARPAAERRANGRGARERAEGGQRRGARAAAAAERL